MWDMAKSSITLFFQGKLFAEPAKVYRQMVIGALIAALIFVGLVFVGLPPVVAAAIAGFVGGIVQPILFKDLRYR